MEFRYRALLLLIPAALFTGFTLRAQVGADLQPATLGGLAAPILDEKTDRYLGILYADEGRISGYQLQNVRFDFMKSEVSDPAMIKDVRRALLYPIGCDSLSIVDRFWSTYPHSQAIMESKRMVLNPQERSVSSEDEVRLYSRDADLRGTGFTLHYDARKLVILDSVRLTIRMDSKKNNSAERLNFDLIPASTQQDSTLIHTKPLPSSSKGQSS